MTTVYFQLIARLGNTQTFIQNHQRFASQGHLLPKVIGKVKFGVAPRGVAGHRLCSLRQFFQFEAESG